MLIFIYSLDDDDQPYTVLLNHRYIVKAGVDGGDDEIIDQFILVFTTKKLQQRQSMSSNLQVDGTYKLSTLNYPLLVCFYLFIIMLSLIFLGRWLL